MARRVIDTNQLILLWRGGRPAPGPIRSEASARAAAEAWLRANPEDGVLTPIRLELLGGARDRDEVRLAEYFLALFPLFDGGVVLPEDWAEALRLARRVPFSGRPRGALDCLIRAVSRRLRLTVLTADGGMPPA